MRHVLCLVLYLLWVVILCIDEPEEDYELSKWLVEIEDSNDDKEYINKKTGEHYIITKDGLRIDL